MIYFYLYCIFLYKFIYANSVDTDQTRFAVSDLCLHCLPRSQKRDDRHKQVKNPTIRVPFLFIPIYFKFV